MAHRVEANPYAERHALTIGTRASKLALVQAEIVRSALLAQRPDLEIRLEHITTMGDMVQDRPLSEIGGNGLFVTQIEEALRGGSVDIAVHSAKDLSSALHSELLLAAFLPRADARDVLICREAVSLAELPQGARVGTSSPRRTCQLRAMRPDLTMLDIRGNVDTRLRKLNEGQYDAIVLAAAGLERMGLLDMVTEWFPVEVMIPAVAQGTLAVQVRANDHFTHAIVGEINDPYTAVAARCERAFLARIGGDCALPVGAYATITGDAIRTIGMVGSVEGHVLRGEHVATADEPERAGRELAEQLLSMGAGTLMEKGDLGGARDDYR